MALVCLPSANGCGHRPWRSVLREGWVAGAGGGGALCAALAAPLEVPLFILPTNRAAVRSRRPARRSRSPPKPGPAGARVAANCDRERPMETGAGMAVPGSCRGGLMALRRMAGSDLERVGRSMDMEAPTEGMELAAALAAAALAAAALARAPPRPPPPRPAPAPAPAPAPPPAPPPAAGSPMMGEATSAGKPTAEVAPFKCTWCFALACAFSRCSCWARRLSAARLALARTWAHKGVGSGVTTHSKHKHTSIQAQASESSGLLCVPWMSWVAAVETLLSRLAQAKGAHWAAVHQAASQRTLQCRPRSCSAC